MTDHAGLAEIRALVDGYAVALDTRDVDLFRSLWTDDGVLSIHRGEGPTSRYEGAAAMGDVVERLRSSYRSTVHVVGSHRAVVRDDGRVAVGVTSGVGHHIVPPEGAPGALADRQLGLRYVDGYRREGDVWRIATRQCHQLWVRTVDVEGPR